ncbi:MAG: DNA mismatch repair endonuclease MutL [Erysipelotrichales bacterium]|nr:DNA mismatch repair endonuclease MutL [Erysipelotrichales bacterium]
MGKINKLSDQLTNMIAAGEVVERPMGVVKELVENAMDAGATEIEIQMEDGGLKRMTVIDNGSGMDPQDAVFSLERHATSKISKTEDLWNIHTMGFRGEALPSIASVSKFTLLTNDGNGGTEIRVEYGKTVYAGPKAAPEGTRISVEDLFYKTPARLKHMRSAQSEGSAIIDLVEKFAFGRPDIAFRLISNGILRYETTGTGDLKEVLYRTYGADIAESAITAKFEDYDFSVECALAMPEFNRASRNFVNVYLNDRMIRSYGIQKAVLSAYDPYHAPDRYPIAVVKIQADPHLVDVNVHPSKWEVRLSKQKQLESLIESNIREILKKETETRKMPFAAEPVVKQENEIKEYTDKETAEPKKVQQSLEAMFDVTYVTQKPETLDEFFPKQPLVMPEEPEMTKVPEEPAGISDESCADSTKSSKLPPLRIIGQYRRDYILAEGEDGLYIIDQHAAAERSNFEKFSRMVNRKPYSMQNLLMPVTLELTPSEFNEWDRISSFMEDLGLKLEPFGGHTVLLREIPVWMSGADVNAILKDLLDLYNEDRKVTRADYQKHAVATMACHGSVRFNRNLTLDEMNKILEDLNRCEQPFNCPHGRPTLIKITDKDLRKEFERG